MAESSTRVPSLAHLSAVLGTEDYAILRTENYASPPPHKTLHAVYCASTRTDVPRPPRHSAGADTRLQQRLHTEPRRKGPAAHRGQRPAQVQPRAPLRQHRRHAEAGEHGAGAQQRREQQRRVDGQRGRDQRAQRGALAERRAAQQQVPARREAAASGADGPRSRSAPPAQSPAGQRHTVSHNVQGGSASHAEQARQPVPRTAVPCYAGRRQLLPLRERLCGLLRDQAPRRARPCPGRERCVRTACSGCWGWPAATPARRRSRQSPACPASRPRPSPS